MKILKKERCAHGAQQVLPKVTMRNNAWKYAVVQQSREEAPWKNSL